MVRLRYTSMLPQLQRSFTRQLLKAFQELFPQYSIDPSAIILTIPPKPEMGDFAYPCFELAKLLHTSPHEVSRQLAEKLKPTKLIVQYKALGPYLNLTVKRSTYIHKVIHSIEKEQQVYGETTLGKRKRIMIEYSSPNTNKPQHLGHVRNNVFGAALANILATSGYRVVKASIVNDRGIHITKSMLAYQKWGKGATPESTKEKGDHFVGKWYVRFEQEAKKDPRLLEEAQELLRTWESGDTKTHELWKKMNAWVLEGFAVTYERLGITFDKVYFESKLYKNGKKIVVDALAQGLCYKRPDGAIEVDLTEEGLDKKVLLRADGTSIYITQDLGATVKKFQDYQLDAAYWIVASEQNYHFHVLFALLKKFGYPFWKQCHHIAYDLVLLPHGRMKSREGTTVDADNILDTLEELAAKTIQEKHGTLTKKEINIRAHAIALGALKFMLLKVSTRKTITFHPESAISFEGDTGPYVQYTYARLQSILRKGKTDKNALFGLQKEVLNAPEELALAKMLAAYPEVITRAAQESAPALIATYLLETAAAGNTLYHTLSVLKAKEKSVRIARLSLIQATATVLRNGLALLDIHAPEKM